MLKAEILQNNVIIISDNTVSDSVKFETVHFKFPKSWEGFNKTAVFTSSEGEAYNVVLAEGNSLCVSEAECYIPHEVLNCPGFEISVFGVLGESVATATKAFVKVLQSGLAEGEEPQEPTPSEYQQILSLVNNAQEIAQSVRDDADNGVFDGQNGDKGDKGDNAITDTVYDPTSANAQSGVALAPIFQKKLEMWQPNTEYKVGDIVLAEVYEGEDRLTAIVRCKQEHTSAENEALDADLFSVYWENYSYIDARNSLCAAMDVNGNRFEEYYATKAELSEEMNNVVFTVLITYDADGNISTDKTLDEIITAYNSGKVVLAKTTADGMAMIGQLTYIAAEVAEFSVHIGNFSRYAMLITADDVAISQEDLVQGIEANATVDAPPSASAVINYVQAQIKAAVSDALEGDY